MNAYRRILIVAAASVVLAATACSGGGGTNDAAPASTTTTSSSETIPQPPLGKLRKLPIAPDSERVDLAQPSFSNPTRVTNPLFPISRLRSALLLGTEDGKRLRVETTLLPYAKTVSWSGERFKALESQYLAYVDGRIHEVALDWYAQADDGSVWYLGEDVFNYEDGAVADTEGTWLAGRHAPAAMIMPARPKVGDVYRPENAPGIVFEEVTVKAVGRTVDGPRGRVAGAIVVEELHQDGKRETKTFAPGYGEFLTGGGGNLEAVAVAVPTDAVAGPQPAELRNVSGAADDAFEAARSKDWPAARAAVETVSRAWEALRAGDLPPRLETQLGDALTALAQAVEHRKPRVGGHAALDVAEAALDLRLRHRPPAEIDLARFDLRARRLLLDAAAGDAPAVAGDVVVLEWIRDRLSLDVAGAKRIDDQLRYLSAAAQAEEHGAVSRATDALIVISSTVAIRGQNGSRRAK